MICDTTWEIFWQSVNNDLWIYALYLTKKPQWISLTNRSTLWSASLNGVSSLLCFYFTRNSQSRSEYCSVVPYVAKAKGFQDSNMYQSFQNKGINIFLLFLLKEEPEIHTLSWLSMAPFGFPVVPDVYISTQHWFGFWELIISSKVVSDTSSPSSRNSSI